MGRPPKAVVTLEQEGKSHRTKAELQARKAGEESVKSGKHLIERKEVRADKVAHKEFRRLKKLLEGMDKADELYSSGINRYCQLYSECFEMEKLREIFRECIEEIEQDKEKIVEDYVTDKTRDTISLSQYYRLKNNFSNNILGLDAAIMKKRKMLLDIEKENIMTVAAGLRSIPKEPTAKENPLAKALADDDDDEEDEGVNDS